MKYKLFMLHLLLYISRSSNNQFPKNNTDVTYLDASVISDSPKVAESLFRSDDISGLGGSQPNTASLLNKRPNIDINQTASVLTNNTSVLNITFVLVNETTDSLMSFMPSGATVTGNFDDGIENGKSGALIKSEVIKKNEETNQTIQNIQEVLESDVVPVTTARISELNEAEVMLNHVFNLTSDEERDGNFETTTQNSNFESTTFDQISYPVSSGLDYASPDGEEHIGEYVPPTDDTDVHPSGAEESRVSISKTLITNETDVNNFHSQVISVRKCCKSFQFFSLRAHSCEQTENDINFNNAVLLLTKDRSNTTRFEYKSSPVSCSEHMEPPSIVSDVRNMTHRLLESGNMLDLITQLEYSRENYCLELVGNEADESPLTLAYCAQSPLVLESSESSKSPRNENDSSVSLKVIYKHIVRKCCGENEYYNSDFHKCADSNYPQIFSSAVKELSFDNKNVDLDIFSARIDKCPNSPEGPNIISVDSNSFRLLRNGELVEVVTGVHHNYTHYCLEMVGPDEQNVFFTLALCSNLYAIPKCCPDGHYFNEIHLDCFQIPEEEESNDLLSHFHLDSESYAAKPVTQFLKCKNTFPVQEDANNLFISEGKLCNNVACFEKDNFCVDFIGHKNKNLEPKAFYCQKEYFVKCCKEGYILSERGCIAHNETNSVMLENLINSRNFINSFDSRACRRGKGILLDESFSSYIIWWVSSDGSYLTVNADSNKKNVHQYCVDDFKDNDNKIGPSAYVCESEVNHLLPNDHHFLRYSKAGSLGKCCPEYFTQGFIYYYSTELGSCELIALNRTLMEDEHLAAGSFTSEHFHDFPPCPDDIVAYHRFSFIPGPYDHAEISPQGVLKIISKDGECTHREDIVEDRDYCIEYTLTENGQLMPSAFMCAYAPVIDVYREKFTLVTTLLGISSVCLFLTLIYLFTVRVRRGFITVRKVNTLAGRILVSFISSHLIGFVAFSLTQQDNDLNKENTVGCYILAGFVQFFNLATFCWNTSICLESLLLTIDISISKCIRYMLHSIWAWGFPLTMTLLMFLMDAHRDQLPCGSITPKIGVYVCFHSENDAILLYFYVPILITLLLNVLFLISGRFMRNRRLRRLEMGKPVKDGQGQTSNTTDGHSGMRTHQNKNTKAESLRIVLWTGGTWFIELIGFVLTRYIVNQYTQAWYEYLWYIPTSINALRGVGIFCIIVITPDKKKEIHRIVSKASARLQRIRKAWKLPPRNSVSGRRESEFNRKTPFHDERKRNMSVTTMISTLSSSFYTSSSFVKDSESPRKASVVSIFSSKIDNFRKSSVSNNNNLNAKPALKPIRKTGMIRSISQIDRLASCSSNSFLDELEMEEDCNKRRMSVPLPKLQEEPSVYRDESSQIAEENESVLEDGTEDLEVVDTLQTEIEDAMQTRILNGELPENIQSSEISSEQFLDLESSFPYVVCEMPVKIDSPELEPKISKDEGEDFVSLSRKESNISRIIEDEENIQAVKEEDNLKGFYSFVPLSSEGEESDSKKVNDSTFHLTTSGSYEGLHGTTCEVEIDVTCSEEEPEIGFGDIS